MPCTDQDGNLVLCGLLRILRCPGSGTLHSPTLLRDWPNQIRLLLVQVWTTCSERHKQASAPVTRAACGHSFSVPLCLSPFFSFFSSFFPLCLPHYEADSGWLWNCLKIKTLWPANIGISSMHPYAVLFQALCFLIERFL